MEGVKAQVIVIRHIHAFTCPSRQKHLLLLLLFLLQLFPFFPILAHLLDRCQVYTSSSCPFAFASLLYHHVVGVTVGCAASCLLSPCTSGTDRRNYSISSSLWCVGPPASSAEPQEFLSADQSNSALPHVL